MYHSISTYLVDVLLCQQIKLIQVVSTSESHEYWWNKVDFFLSLPFSAGPQKLWTLTASKIKYENFDKKFRFLIKKRTLTFSKLKK